MSPTTSGGTGPSGPSGGRDGQFPSGASLGAPADMIGSARVTARLGEGSLSEVFRAEQAAPRRAVAIKLLKGSVAPASQLGQRFAREAALLGRLSHQNLPQVHEAGEIDGRPFMVLELVEGPTLRQVLEKHGPPPPDVVTVIAAQLAAALEYLHLRGIIHRDLKPANVMIARTGEVKLVDLGLAIEEGEAPDGLGVVGTPVYMSPEQVLGDRLDFRADIFSFGILLYELLTGRRPFEEDPTRTVMQKIRLDRYPSVRTLRPQVPAALERVLARCLEKHPSHRYPSTGLLSADLAEIATRSGIASLPARLGQWLSDVGEGERSTGRPSALATAASHWSRERPSGNLRPVLVAQTVFAIAVLATVASAEVSHRRRGASLPASSLGPRPAGTSDVGHLRVVARPWASIALDGITVDTTPTAQAFRLAPGPHFVRLTHPTRGTVDRTVQIERGATVWLDVDMPAPSGHRTAGAP